MNHPSIDKIFLQKQPLLSNWTKLNRIHKRARGSCSGYPKRSIVSDEYVSWDKKFISYKPIDYTSPSVLMNKNANSDSVVPSNYYTLENNGHVRLEDGLPLNPGGRTGMKGRGRLWKWGPSLACDPIVTRINPKTGKLEMVAIKRKDSGEWAISGGFVDSGELVSSALEREFEEETGNIKNEHKNQRKKDICKLFDLEKAIVVYMGYVDDPRNTDNSWIETVAINFHCTKEVASSLILNAGDDAAEVKWLACDSDDINNLYASHRIFIEAVFNYHSNIKKFNPLCNQISKINFYMPKSKYGCFSNFSPHNVEYAGHIWPTSEHAFQAQKHYPNKDPAGKKRVEDILNAPTPKRAKNLGNSRKPPNIRSDWPIVKYEIMRNIVLAKFTQNKEIRDILLSTNDAMLVEHTSRDNVWGDGGNGSGENHMGRILMSVREELQMKYSSNSKSIDSKKRKRN